MVILVEKLARRKGFEVKDSALDTLSVIKRQYPEGLSICWYLLSTMLGFSRATDSLGQGWGRAGGAGLNAQWPREVVVEQTQRDYLPGCVRPIHLYWRDRGDTTAHSNILAPRRPKQLAGSVAAEASSGF
mgnify:CR=1